jgi:formyl-CoA transferase
VPVKLGRTPGDPNRLPGPGLGEHTDEVLRALGYDDAQLGALKESGAVAGPATESQGSFLA